MTVNKTAPSKTKTYKKVRASILDWMDENSTVVTREWRWYVGITNSPKTREKQHNSKNKRESTFWKAWNMKSVRLSLALETALHNKGLLDKDIKGGYKENSIWIYVYKKHPTILD